MDTNRRYLIEKRLLEIAATMNQTATKLSGDVKPAPGFATAQMAASIREIASLLAETIAEPSLSGRSP